MRPEAHVLSHRYSDLVCHYQIKSVLKGKAAPFGAVAMKGHNKRVEERAHTLRELESEVHEHFLAIYFAQHPDRTYKGEVLAFSNDGKAVVIITDLGLERTCHAPGALRIGGVYSWKPDIHSATGLISWHQVVEQ
jgi:exoribonuclease R